MAEIFLVKKSMKIVSESTLHDGLETIKIFLSGSVKKGENDKRSDEFFWSDEEELLLKNSVEGYVEILNPNTIKIPKYLSRERFVADMEMLLQSDVVVVDARTKKGLGIGAEMALAKQHEIPVFVLCPFGSEYRGRMDMADGTKQEWTHPFVLGLSDKLFETIEDLAKEINAFRKK